MGFNLSNIGKKFKKVRKDLAKNAKVKFAKFKNKNALIDSLTLKEAEKVYKTWIDTSLMKQVTVRNSKDQYVTKKVRMSPKQINTAIKLKVSLDKVIMSIPRLKRQADEFEKQIKKIK